MMGVAITAIVVVALVGLNRFFFLDNSSFDGNFTHQLDIWTEPKDFEYDIRISFFETR